ncbi:DUF6262 family protein [Gordonia sp. DT30]|uniref:DUF6262 family protein n=1 Tax=Gordonia sp. DT30 TaxID=3416546 RepID=UPI003CE888B8
MSQDQPRRNKGNTSALKRARSEAAARKLRDVVVALQQASDRAMPLTVSTLASAAGVSRQFLYSHPELIRQLRAHQERYPLQGNTTLADTKLADLANAHAVIKRLQKQVAELNSQLDAGLAAQLELRDERRLRQSYDQRGDDLNRVLTENFSLKQTVSALQERIRTLEDDLTVERSALRELVSLSTTVRPLHPDKTNAIGD